MERRRAKRIARRFRVHVRDQATGEVLSGFTGNVSTGGAYLSTVRVLPLQTRIELEIEAPSRSYAFEALVVRIEKVAPELRAVKQAGYGVRFLTVEDLVHEMLRPAAAPPAKPAGAAAMAAASSPPAEAPAPAVVVTSPTAQQAGALAKASAPASTAPVLELRIRDLQHLIAVCHREISRGALLVPSAIELDYGTEVVVALHLPSEVGGTLEMRGKVLRRIEASSVFPAGVAVELVDTSAALAWLKPFMS